MAMTVAFQATDTSSILVTCLSSKDSLAGRYGGTGRRSGLKIHWWEHRESSNLSSDIGILAKWYSVGISDGVTDTES